MGSFLLSLENERMKVKILAIGIFAILAHAESCTWTFNNSCYTLIESEQEFFHAQAQCDVNYGATLASITSQEEDDFLHLRLEEHYGNPRPCGQVVPSDGSNCNSQTQNCYCRDDVCLTATSSSYNCYEGNVMVEGRSVCDDYWDLVDADVVCKQLGFRGAKENIIDSTFGSVPNNFILDDIDCEGDETDIRDCTYDEDDDCGSSEGAGVICNDDFGVWIGGLIDIDGWIWVSGEQWGYTNWESGMP